MVEGLLVLSTNWYMMSSKYSHEVASIKDLVQFMAKQFQQDNFINAGNFFHCNSNNVQTKEKQQEFINRYILRTDKQKTFEKIFGGLVIRIEETNKPFEMLQNQLKRNLGGNYLVPRGHSKINRNYHWCCWQLWWHCATKKFSEVLLHTYELCFTLTSYPHQNGDHWTVPRHDTINRRAHV